MRMSEPDADISAASDPAASTAEFRAFASRTGGEDERPWALRAGRNRVMMIAAAVVAVVVVIIIVVSVG
jgi:hypothetical protein